MFVLSVFELTGKTYICIPGEGAAGTSADKEPVKF